MEDCPRCKKGTLAFDPETGTKICLDCHYLKQFPNLINKGVKVSAVDNARKHAAIASLICLVAGIALGFIFQPLGGWLLGRFTWEVSLIVALLLTWFTWSQLHETSTVTQTVAYSVVTPLTTIILTAALVLAGSIIMDLAFVMRLHTSFEAYYGIIQPAMSQTLINSIFSGPNAWLTMIGLAFSVLAGFLIVIFFVLLTSIVLNRFQPSEESWAAIRTRNEALRAQKAIAELSESNKPQDSNAKP